MAQILIKRREHFAEAAKPASWSDLKWSGRPLRGDIVEVRPNGYWRIEALGEGTHSWDRSAFALIDAPNVSEATIAHLTESYSNATEGVPATVQFKRRYRFDLWASVPWIVNTVTINGQQVEEWYYRHMAALGSGAARIQDKVV